MKVMVNGEARELVAMGINGIEWTNDLLGNYDALHYDNDTDEYTMTEEEFEWWEPVVDMLNEVNELEQELDEDARAEYDAQSFDYSELDDEVRAKLDWLKANIQISRKAKNMKTYTVIDKRDRDTRSELKHYTFAELKAFFEPDAAELPEYHEKWAEIKSLYDLECFLEEEAGGMAQPYEIKECEEFESVEEMQRANTFFKRLKF